MRIKNAVNSLIKELEGEHYVFDYFFKRELHKNLIYSFRDYYDVGFKQLKQIEKYLQKKIKFSPTISGFSLTYFTTLFKSVFNKKEIKVNVITKRAFLNYDHFYSFVTEAINQSDLYEVQTKK